MTPEPVQLDDPRLIPYRALRDKDLAREAGLFVAEGFEVVNHLVRSQWKLRSILVAESRWPRLAERLAAAESSSAGEGATLPGPVFTAPVSELSKLVGFPIHRGVLALGERGSGPDPALEAPGTSVVLALAGLANHDNVGAAFRNAAGFGARAVLLDGATADPLYRKALRVSMGHVLRVPWARSGAELDVINRLEMTGHRIIGLSPGAPLSLERALRDLGSRIAIVIGAEGPGLSTAVLSRVIPASIPMMGGTDSLNAATAAAIALYAATQVDRSSH